jgi:hypothetical protein
MSRNIRGICKNFLAIENKSIAYGSIHSPLMNHFPLSLVAIRDVSRPILKYGTRDTGRFFKIRDTGHGTRDGQKHGISRDTGHGTGKFFFKFIYEKQKM